VCVRERECVRDAWVGMMNDWTLGRCECVCVCVYVCVCVREGKRERESVCRKEKEIEREGQRNNVVNMMNN